MLFIAMSTQFCTLCSYFFHQSWLGNASYETLKINLLCSPTIAFPFANLNSLSDSVYLGVFQSLDLVL